MTTSTQLRLVALGLLAAVFVTFLATLDGQFVYDDLLLIQNNAGLRDLANVPRAFTQSFWEFAEVEYRAEIGYWRPLSTVALTLGYALDGGQPMGFHVLSLVIHAAATLAALGLARRLGLAPVLAGLAAALFALHPIQAEAVSWASSITDPLLALWTFVALERWVAWRDGGSTGLPIGAALAAAAALLTKEPAVFLPAAFLAIDYARGEIGPRSATDTPWARARTPLLLGAILGLGYYLARVVVFANVGAGLETATTNFEFSFSREWLLRLEVIGGALQVLFAPFTHLQVFRPIDPQRTWTDPEALALWWGVVVIGVALVVAWRRRATVATIGVALILLPLLPLPLRIESLGQYPVGDRYLVVPALGLGLLLVGALERLQPTSTARRAGIAALLALIAASAFVAHDRTRVWKDERILFTTAVEETPESALPHWSLGRVLLREFRGQREKDLELLSEVLASFERAQDICVLASPSRREERALVSTFDLLQSNVGYALAWLEAAPFEGYDDYATPRQLFEMLLEQHPLSVEAWGGLGQTLLAMGEQEEAREAFDRATEINPNYAPAWHGLGRVYYSAGRMTKAAEAFERVLELRIGEVNDLLWAARAEIDGGRSASGERHLTRALELDPEAADAHVLLAVIDVRGQRFVEALQHADEALVIDPKKSLAHNERGKALMSLGENDEALLAFRRACDFGPEYFEPHYHVASLLLGTGAIDAATPYLERAYEFCPDPGIRSTIRARLAEGIADEAGALLAIGRIDFGRRDLEPALYWALRAVEVAPENVEVLRFVATVHQRRDEADRAVPYLRQADRLLPDTFGIVRELALCLVAANDLDAARTELERALSLLPPPERLQGGAQTHQALSEELKASLETLGIGPSPR